MDHVYIRDRVTKVYSCKWCGKLQDSIGPIYPIDPPGGGEIMSLNSEITPGTPELTLVSTVVEQYDYVYNGSSLVQMVKTTTTTADEETTTSTDTLFFAYDASGSPLSVTYNNTDYYYTANIQGDIVGIVDNTGTQVVSYTYDAWGNALTVTGTLSETLGSVNPLRYRGYVYDTDTGLFYLQSRYYSPEIGRFINADGLVSTGQGLLGNNMFAYCNSNPTNRVDCIGQSPDWMPWSDAFEDFGWWLRDALEEWVDEKVRQHYNRNDNQPESPEKYDPEYFKDWDDGVSANCHQFSSPDQSNRKYVSEDGLYEVIYDSNGQLVTDPRDVGTYNYAPPDDYLGHFFKDVLPWILWGNSLEDQTKWYERLLGFFGANIS